MLCVWCYVVLIGVLLFCVGLVWCVSLLLCCDGACCVLCCGVLCVVVVLCCCCVLLRVWFRDVVLR